MSKHLPRWLNDAALSGMGGCFEGVIDDVLEERVRNFYKRDEQTGKPLMEKQPVIVFKGGWRIVPNIGMRRTLIEALGAETDRWIGQHLVIERQQAPTGKWQKSVRVADIPRERFATDVFEADDEMEVEGSFDIEENDLRAEGRITRGRR
jgi:hypothetical protein